MFVIDAKKENIAVKEAERMHIPCIGVVDTNCDPDVVPIPVPANDDAIRSVNLLVGALTEPILEALAELGKHFPVPDEPQAEQFVPVGPPPVAPAADAGTGEAPAPAQ
jgi:ribosomal protein S2